jgi:hypothetical protein
MCFYNHAHRIRLEKLLYLELSRSPNGFLNRFWLLDLGGGFVVSEAVGERPLRNRFIIETVTDLKR